MSDLITPDLDDIPEDNKAEPKTANVEHLATADDVDVEEDDA